MKAITSTKTVGKRLYKKMNFSFDRFNSLKKKNIEASKNNLREAELSLMICPLTGVFNRTGLNSYFDKMVPSHLKNSTMVLIEIDNLTILAKKYNKSVIDNIIRNFVTEITGSIQPNDVIARWALNSFVLFCHDTTLDDTEALTHNIRRKIKTKVWEKSIKLTCSIGVTQTNGEALNELISNTQAALSKTAKNSSNRAYTEKTNRSYVQAKSNIETKIGTAKSAEGYLSKSVLNRSDLTHYFEKTESSAIQRMSIIFISLNNVETILQTYGTDVLDEILHKFISEINNICRVCDKLANWSDNEYLLACPNTSIYHATGIAYNITLALQNRTWLKELDLSCSTEVFDSDCDEINAHYNKKPEVIPTVDYSFVEDPIVEKSIELSAISTKSIEIPEINNTSTVVCPITGALNRAGLHHYLSEKDPVVIQNMSVVFIEIDELEIITQRYGKSVSDEILHQFATVVNNIDNSVNTLASWSTNEYLLICDATSLDSAVSIAKKIRLAIQNNAWSNGINLQVCTEVYNNECNELTANLTKTLYDINIADSVSVA